MFSPFLSRLTAHLPFINEAQKGEWKTAGGPEADATSPPKIMTLLASTGPAYSTGWWKEARRTPAHYGRIGGVITPRGLVVHTTDMYPGTFDIIVKRWTQERGKGNAATWLIGRSPVDGVVQFAPIYRNSNHAGGANHGWVREPGSINMHPNSVYVGVEVDNAGRLAGKGGKFYHPDTGKVIPAEDVFIDEKGRPWHKVTDYQISVLKLLWKDLYPMTRPFKPGTQLILDASYESQGSAWAKPRYTNLVGHASLNPIRKSDPGPQIMEWMNS